MIVIFRKSGKPLPKIVTTFPIPRQEVWVLHLLKGKQKATGLISSFLPRFLPFSPYFSLSPPISLFLSSKPTEWSMLQAGWISPGPSLPSSSEGGRKSTVVSALDVARRDMACKSPRILSKTHEVSNLHLISRFTKELSTGKFLSRWIQLEKLRSIEQMFFHLPKWWELFLSHEEQLHLAKGTDDQMRLQGNQQYSKNCWVLSSSWRLFVGKGE